MKDRKFDLQEGLIDYAVQILKMSEKLPNTKTDNHIWSQILMSGTSPTPNYGESQSAESKPDFIHKLKVALKGLRETEVWLKIDELISILVISIQTAKIWLFIIPCSILDIQNFQDSKIVSRSLINKKI